MNAIEISKLNFFFRQQPILQNVNLSIGSGEFIGIFGPNGGGKTTLLKLLMGFLPPESGKVRIFGAPPEKIRHKIGYVPQVHRPEPDFPITVAEIIAMGLISKRPFFGRFSKTDWQKCDDWMERLGIIAHRDKAYGELSGGLAQRALLARALISDPDLLLLDEPTASIDQHSLAIFQKTIESLKGKKTILLVTHDLSHVVKQASRLFCVKGTISSFQPQEICEHYNLGLYHAEIPPQQLIGR